MAYFKTESGQAINEYLYSTHNATFDSATLAASTVTADANGDKIARKGTVLAAITSGVDSGKAGAYDTGASDGRETAGNILGVSDVRLNVRNGDFEVAYLYTGVVREASVFSDGTQGSLSAAVKTAIRSEAMHILVK